MVKINLVGERFGRLKVVSELPERKNRRIIWLCKCDCGKDTCVSGADLKGGNTRSCGCLWIDAAIKSSTKHGFCKSPEYAIWATMIQRCTNPKNKSYKNYGARGISVCDEWFDFSCFIKDIGLRPNSNYSLERIRVNQGYNNINCIWIEKHLQQKNTTRTIRYTYNGVTKIQSDWSKYYGISNYRLVSIIKRVGVDETFKRLNYLNKQKDLKCQKLKKSLSQILRQYLTYKQISMVVPQLLQALTAQENQLY